MHAFPQDLNGSRESSDDMTQLELDFGNNYKPENTNPLAQLWPHLVGPWEERHQASAPLLREVVDGLRARLGVLPRSYDLAVGIGADLDGLAHLLLGNRGKTRTLLELSNGDLSWLEGNELDPHFRNIARQNLDAKGLHDVKLYSDRWEHMSRVVPTGSVQFAQCMGNSLVCCGNTEEQAAALMGMREIMEPNVGRLLLDVRNWVNVKQKIAQAIAEQGKMSVADIDGRPMYNGQDVASHPVAIGDEAVKFRYVKVPSTDQGDELLTGDLVMATPDIISFIQLIEAVGFRVEQVLSDFKPGRHYHNINGKDTNFFQIVASVPSKTYVSR